jgi:rhodanese-related sulfurtransferase
MRLSQPRQIIVALGVSFLAAVWMAERSSTAGISELEALEAHRTIKERSALVIDVRPRDAYDRERVPGALSVPVGELERRLPELAAAKDRPIVVYCGDGNSGARATRTLNENGFADTANVRGGIAAWKDAKLPVVH